MFWLVVISGSLMLIHVLLLFILKMRKKNSENQRGYGALTFPRFEIFLVILALPCIFEASAALVRGTFQTSLTFTCSHALAIKACSCGNKVPTPNLVTLKHIVYLYIVLKRTFYDFQKLNSSYFHCLRRSAIRGYSWQSVVGCHIFSASSVVPVPLSWHHIWKVTSIQGSASRRPGISLVSRDCPSDVGSRKKRSVDMERPTKLCLSNHFWPSF